MIAQKLFFSLLLVTSYYSVIHAQVAKKVPVVAKIAVVDDERIANPYDSENSPVLKYQDLMGALKQEMNKRSSQLQAKQAQYQSLAKQVEASGKKPDADTMAQLKKLANVIEIDAQTAERYVQEETGKFRDEVNEAVEEIKKEQGWTHVASARAFLAFDKNTDITDELVERLNKKYRAEQRAKKFVKSEKMSKSEQSEE